MKRLLTRRRLLLAAGLLVLVAGAVVPALYKIELGKSAAAPAVVARYAPELPADPWDPAWRRAPAVRLPVSVVATPGARPIRDVTVRALNDGKRVAFRLEWADDTQEVTTLRPQDFGDQAAVQLTTGPVNVCMGQAGRYAHIWHWKADWQYGSRDMKRQYPNLYTDGYSVGDRVLWQEDLFTRPAATVGNLRARPAHDTPVEHLIAGGFSSLTTVPDPKMQNVGGSGVWRSGKWAVVFVRELAAAGEGDLALVPGEPAQVAFAVWDGKQMQRDGMKYTTTWATLTLDRPPLARR